MKRCGKLTMVLGAVAVFAAGLVGLANRPVDAAEPTHRAPVVQKERTPAEEMERLLTHRVQNLAEQVVGAGHATVAVKVALEGKRIKRLAVSVLVDGQEPPAALTALVADATSLSSVRGDELVVRSTAPVAVAAIDAPATSL